MRIPLIHQPLLLGLDFQPEGIRLAQLGWVWASCWLKRIGTLEVPENSMANARVINWEQVTKTIADYVEANGLRKMITAISLPSEIVKSEELDLPPALADEEIRSEIKIRIRQQLSGLKNDYAMDFKILGTQPSSGLKIVYAVVRKTELMKYVSSINNAGLKLAYVDVDIFALHRLHEAMKQKGVHTLNKENSREKLLKFLKIKNEQANHIEQINLKNYKVAIGTAMRRVSWWQK